MATAVAPRVRVSQGFGAERDREEGMSEEGEKEGHDVLSPYPCDAAQAGGGNGVGGGRPRTCCLLAGVGKKEKENKVFRKPLGIFK